MTACCSAACAIFLHWYWGVNWPVFNIADCCLVIGAGLLLLQAFRPQPTAEEEPPAETMAVAKAGSPFASVESK